MKYILVAIMLFPCALVAQLPSIPFETSGGKQSATYAQCIAFYKRMDALSSSINIRSRGMSDAGYPYDVVLYSPDGTNDPAIWHKQHKLVILIINGIHPGEPDGIDASMLLLRDIYLKRIIVPGNIALAIIPVYNIGGALNRNSFSRVNQNGPEAYGFRGNAQNLDLNRDFTKCDSRDAKSFASIFHWIDPEVQVDNHVSDGADYQYTMTLISTQWNKLGGKLGQLLHNNLDPALYSEMKKRNWEMTPYVNVENEDPSAGWEGFYDSPRYSSGYAALFHTIGFITETHMLKPFADRVRSTQAFMECMITACARLHDDIIAAKASDIKADLEKKSFALGWKTDSTHADSLLFKGYTAAHTQSEVTGQQRLYYDRTKPYTTTVPYYNYVKEEKIISAPAAYIIPQGWHDVTDLLTLQHVEMKKLTRDTSINVEVYYIDSVHPLPLAYEKHHKNLYTTVHTAKQLIHFRAGDFIIHTNQPAKRFIIEMLEPTGDDSYFSWNYFDAILQQKEGYSDYRWEDVAADFLSGHPDVKQALEEKKKNDSLFAKDADAQLAFVYEHSPWYEPEHRRYPVYRLMK